MRMDASIRFRGIIVIGFVLDNGGFAGDDKAVGKAFGDIKLEVVLGG